MIEVLIEWILWYNHIVVLILCLELAFCTIEVFLAKLVNRRQDWFTYLLVKILKIDIELNKHLWKHSFK